MNQTSPVENDVRRRLQPAPDHLAQNKIDSSAYPRAVEMGCFACCTSHRGLKRRLRGGSNTVCTRTVLAPEMFISAGEKWQFEGGNKVDYIMSSNVSLACCPSWQVF